jgi:hypothetical protein
MKRKGFFSRLADKLFGGIKPRKRKARKQPPRETSKRPPVPSAAISSGVEVRDGAINYALSGWRIEGGEWQDVEAGAPLPTDKQWILIDLVTVNLAPSTDEGYYRSANVLGGFDAPPNYIWDDKNLDKSGYTLDDLAYELALVYGFAVQ